MWSLLASDPKRNGSVAMLKKLTGRVAGLSLNLAKSGKWGDWRSSSGSLPTKWVSRPLFTSTFENMLSKLG